MIKLNLFEYAVENYSVYPTILGFNYLDQVKSTPGLVDELNSYEFVFVSSDYGVPIPGCEAIQFLTGCRLLLSYHGDMDVDFCQL